MDCGVIIQTCDKYEKFWEGLFHFFEKQWDFQIECPIYFCNEIKEIKLPCWAKQIKTGKGTFVQNLKNILESVPENNVFFLLEDDWPIAPMKKELFNKLYEHFMENNLDSFQVGPYTPYYKLENTNKKINEQNIWKIKQDSDWLFNLQARFWKKEKFKNCLAEPEISEEKLSSAITVEVSSNELAKKNKLNVDFYHYFWYPIAGVAARGQFTKIGNDMQNIVNIDKLAKELIH
jgi:hypothetical protein